MNPFRAFLHTLAAAFLSTAFLFAAPAQAADQRTVFDGLHGQPPQWMQAIRDTFGKVYLTVRIHDISTASNATQPQGGQIVSTVKGNIIAIYTVLTTSLLGINDLGLAAATEIVPSINSTEIVGGTITIASTSFSGTSDGSTPTSARAVVFGDIIKLDSNGKTARSYGLWIVIEIDRDV